MIEDESKFTFLTKKNGGYVTFEDNAKRKIIGQGNIGNDISSLIEKVLLVDVFQACMIKIDCGIRGWDMLTRTSFNNSTKMHL